MAGITLLVYMLAFAVGCMTLALAIVYRHNSPYRWMKYFIVFHASLLGCMMLLALRAFSTLFLGEAAALVVSYIIKVVLTANITFLIVFIPYFTTWVIAHPWRNPYKTIFVCLAALYLIMGILELFINIPTVFETVKTLLFSFDLFFCFGVMLKNLKSIDNRDVRIVCATIIIVSFAMLPALVFGLVFPGLQDLIYAVFFFAFSIAILVFLFIAFSRNQHVATKQKEELTLEKLSEYHITEREFTVIKLISSGATNKEIAAQLGISTNTVNNHVANIFSKTHVRSRIDLLNLLNQAW